jgi:antitoxin YefM
MKATYSVSEAQAQLPRLLRLAEEQALVITRRGKKTSVLLGMDQFDALLETLEIVSNPESMKLLRADQAGRLEYLDLADLGNPQKSRAR